MAALASNEPFWQQTMIRIKDPKVSIPFYQNHFGFTLIDEYHFEEAKFSVYFLSTLPDDITFTATPGTEEAHTFLWNTNVTTIELTHNHGTENDDAYTTNNGNVEPHRGFGHIAVNTDDVYAVSEELIAAGVKFQKKPDEGRMKGLAFALDPDGYWIEIVARHAESGISQKYNLSQTMIRIKDPKASLVFYRDQLGMKVVAEKHFEAAKFSLYFLANSSVAGEVEGDGWDTMKKLYHPVLELTHNHGTEDDAEFSYHNGNTDPRGFGHIGFLVNNLQESCDVLEANGVAFKKKPNEGRMHNIAFALDPDGYWVELIQRGFTV